MALSCRVIELDPISAEVRYDHGRHAYFAGLPGEAEAALRKALELNPQYPGAHSLLGRVYLTSGKPDLALAAMLRETEPVWRTFGLPLAYAALGKKKEADTALAEFIRKYQKDWAYQVAIIYAYRDEPDQVFEWLERRLPAARHRSFPDKGSAASAQHRERPALCGIHEKNETAVVRNWPD